MLERARVRVAALLGVLALSTGTVAGGALWLAAQPAAALTTITVGSSADAGGTCPGATCTLRQAFATASGTAGDVEIDIPASVGTINLTSGELVYSGTANFTVAGNGNTITQGNGARIMVSGTTQTTTVSGLTLNGGQACRGGGIEADGALVITNSTITNATSTCGGGGVFADSVSATNATFSANHANNGSGGGIETSTGSVTLTDSTVTTNTTVDGGGGIAAGAEIDGTPEGSVTLTNSTVDHNTASLGSATCGAGPKGYGGGVEGGALTATNSTITNNTDQCFAGGGVALTESITLTYVTIASNSDAVGANIAGNGGGSSDFTSVASVVALPLGGGTDCHSVTTMSQGYNWDDDGSCGFGAGPGDHSDAGDPLLGALANNGGPTQTRLPQDGPSPLIDAIPVSACQTSNAAGVTTDQRGIIRPQGAGCDIGAVEVGVVTAAPLTAAFTG